MTTTTKTVSQVLGSDQELDLIRFRGYNANYLRLLRQPDGRIDLVDYNCGDTGTDCSNWTCDELMQQALNWLNAVIDQSEENADDDRRDAIEQATAAIC